MEPKKIYRKIQKPKERLRIVLTSFLPETNKSELCRQEGIYVQQLVRWTQDALKGAEDNLIAQPRKKKKCDFEKKNLKLEIISLKEMLFEQTKENLILKKKTTTL